MNTNAEKTPRRKTLKRALLLSFLAVLALAAIFLYNNFNRLLSEALLKSFDSSIVSEVYELKFENLRVNVLDGDIRVFNVSFQPREKPLHRYPYINSSLHLKTEKLTLKNVALFTLLKLNQLKLERISITKPEIELKLEGKIAILLPFKDSAQVTVPAAKAKKPIESFALNQFELIDASFHVANAHKQREFRINGFNISLHDLFINQQPGKDLIAFKEATLSLGEFSGVLRKAPIKRVSFKDLAIRVDSLRFQLALDTVTFHFRDLTTSLKAMDIHTADSLFHLTLQSFDLSYKEKSVKLGEVSFTSNISDAEIQKRHTYQHTSISGTAGALSLKNVNFDSLIYYHGLFIHEVILDKPVVSIFKDNTKPVDKNHRPTYFGQQIRGIASPFWIRQVKVTNIQLTNVERKQDSSYAKVTLYRGTALVRNITNRSRRSLLTLSANAYIEDKVHFDLLLGFSYEKPQFSVDGKLEKFNLPDLNPVIQAYTPAKIHTGTADDISFSGTVYETKASGTMKFLYHNLAVDLDLPKKARWKSSVIAFAANTALNSSNPGSVKLPPKIVQYHTERNMNKGFINIIIKSLLSGLKETMIMSKENKKAYRAAKKKMKGQK